MPLGFVRVVPSVAVATEDAGLSREWMLEAGDMRVRVGRGTAWSDVTRLLSALRSAR